jgi:fumarylacetoacetase
MTHFEGTNDPKLKSWVSVPDDSDFPIQNLPFGIFETSGLSPRAGMAIGDFVIDLSWLHEKEFLQGIDLPQRIFERPVLNDFFALGRQTISEVRTQVSSLMQAGNDRLSSRGKEKFLIPRKDARMRMPIRVPNYTDFYSSEEHAFNVGSMFRDPKNALLPNWKYMPVGYHGRASSIVVSGTDVRRPRGQIKSSDKAAPLFAPTSKLDFELELAFITCGENTLGNPVSAEHAEQYIAGFVLFNDWSARDIQQWEYVPLGPFLGKNFASTISPWVVTLDALEPFRTEGPTQDPAVLPYLGVAGKKNFDITLEVMIQPDKGERTVLCRSNAKYLYWNINQQLAHHTVNGCNIQVGDVYASGTISGPSPGSFGSMLELSWNGQKPLRMPDGTERTFLEDGDTVIMHGCAKNQDVRIGFGECRGRVLPAY